MSIKSGVTEETIWDILRQIPDPELPVINLVDLGVIHRVEMGETIRVEMLPTFVGCPALDMMRREVAQKLAPYGEVEVKVVYSETWTTERISEAGREMLRQAHLVPPPRGNLIDLPVRASRLQGAYTHLNKPPQPVTACPYCGSTDTSLENLFGPTPCRAICYCHACHQPFERFKAV